VRINIIASTSLVLQERAEAGRIRLERVGRQISRMVQSKSPGFRLSAIDFLLFPASGFQINASGEWFEAVYSLGYG
jgi:hypothetical protein